MGAVFARLTRRLGWGLLIAALALVLLAGGVAHSLQHTDRLSGPIIAQFSRLIGYPLNVDRVTLATHGLGLRLGLHGVALHDASGKILLDAARVTIDLDGLASLGALAPRISEVTLAGAHLTMRRNRDGRLAIAGLDRLAAGDGEMLGHLLAQGTLAVEDLDLAWQAGAESPPRPLAQVSLRLSKHAGHAGYAGYAGYAGHTGHTGHTGRRHLTASGMLPAHPGHGRHRAATVLSDQPAAIPFALTSDLDWRPTEQAWLARNGQLVLGTGPRARGAQDLAIRVTSGRDGPRLSGDLRRLDLGVIERLLPAMPASATARLAVIRAARPAGYIEDLTFHASLDGRTAPPDWRIDGRVVGLSTLAVGPIPALQGLNASFDAGPDGGHGHLAATGLMLASPDLFRAPLRIERLAGAVRWRRDVTGGTIIELPALLAETPDIATRSRLRFAVAANGEAPHLALHSHILDGDAAAVPHYLPVGVMAPRLVRWLDQAFIKGRIPNGDLLFAGPVSAFPFDGGEGRFEARFEIADVALQYAPKWPPLTQAAGQVRFSGRQLAIDLTGAQILDTRLDEGHAAITDLGRAKRILVWGDGAGPFADGPRLVDETPMAERFGDLSARLAPSGRMALGLRLNLPFTRGEPLGLLGDVTWPDADASVAIQDTQATLDGLDGHLIITAKGLATEGVTGRLWGQPARLLIRSQQDGTAKEIRVELESTTPVAELARRLPSPIWGMADGHLPWRLELTIPQPTPHPAPPALTWRFTSGLRGLRLDLPGQLAKAAKEPRMLSLTGRSGMTSDRFEVEARLGEAAARLELAPSATSGLHLYRGRINLNGPLPDLPDQAGLAIAGQLAELDLLTWLAWTGDSGLAGSMASRPGTALRAIDLYIDHLQAGAFTSQDASLNIVRHPDQWQASLKGSDIAGSLTVPTGARRQPIEVHMERLELGALADGGGKHATTHRDRRATKTAALLNDPRLIRPLQLDVARLQWDGQPLGALQVRSYATPEGLIFDRLRLDGPAAVIVGSGEWIAGDQQGPRSLLSVQVESDDLGQMLRGFGHAALFADAQAKARLTLGWPGGPLNASLASITGQLDLEIGPGRLPKLEPGLGRILGILNLGAIQRRLALDFRDVFDEGLGFKSIDGSISITDGIAYIDRFEIASPSSHIAITGQTDLLNSQLDQVVSVTPEIGSSIALASAIAGGPLVGAAVYVVDQVAGKVVDRLTRIEYRVDGPWRDLTLVRRNPVGGLLANAKTNEPARDQLNEDQKGKLTPKRPTDDIEEPPNLFLDRR